MRVIVDTTFGRVDLSTRKSVKSRVVPCPPKIDLVSSRVVSYGPIFLLTHMKLIPPQKKTLVLVRMFSICNVATYKSVCPFILMHVIFFVFLGATYAVYTALFLNK